MRRYVCLIIMEILCASCGLKETGEHPKVDDVWMGPGFSISEEGLSGGSMKTVWYVTGFDYPSGYDWRSDADAGTVKCSLTVFVNAVPMLKVPVGDKYKVSAAPDMHRIIDGNLYTEYAADSVTVIRKNGRPFIEYSGEEKIVGMTVEGNDFYTLGQSVAGDGFSYRRNGEVLLARDKGYLFEHYINSDAGHCFAFAEPILSSSSGIERYFVCIGGSVSQIAVRDDVKKVWDVMFYDGKVYYIATLVGVGGPVLVSGEKLTVLQIPEYTQMLSCRFIRGSSIPYIEGVLTVQGVVCASGLWNEGKCVQIFPAGMTVTSIYTDEDGIFAVLTSMDKKSTTIYRCGEYVAAPAGYTLLGEGAISVVNGIMHVGLSSLNGDRPVIWRDGEVEELRLDGYIATVTAAQASQATVRD